MIKYKLTDQNMQTHSGFQWTIGKTETVLTPSDKLCTSGVFHYYHSPEQAAFFNPIHADIKAPLLFEVEIDAEAVSDGTKGGCHAMTPIRELPMPVITTAQRIEIAIRAALLVYSDPSFVEWANNWLLGADRTRAAAARASAAAEARAAAAREAAAAAAARAASEAWEAAAWECVAWEAAARAAARAAAAARADVAIDIQDIIMEVLHDRKNS